MAGPLLPLDLRFHRALRRGDHRAERCHRSQDGVKIVWADHQTGNAENLGEMPGEPVEYLAGDRASAVVADGSVDGPHVVPALVLARAADGLAEKGPQVPFEPCPPVPWRTADG